MCGHRFLLYFSVLFWILHHYAYASSENRDNMHLYKQIKCPTCVAQSVGDSNSIASTQIREYIDERIALGVSDEIVIAEIQQFYGQSIVLGSGDKAAFIFAIGMLLGILFLLIRTKLFGVVK